MEQHASDYINVRVNGGANRLLHNQRVMARHADACNLFGNHQGVRQKLNILRCHCKKEGQAFDETERICLPTFLLARDEAVLKAKAERLGAITNLSKVIEVIFGSIWDMLADPSDASGF